MNATTGLVLSTSLCLILSMFTSLFEACLYAVPISLTRLRAEQGRPVWRLMRRLKENPDRPISGILITNTLANTAGSALAGYFAKDVFGSWGAGVFTAALVLSILWFSEILPKTVGVVFAPVLAPFVAWPIQWLVWFWTPLIRIIELSTGRIRRRGMGTPSITEMELALLARQGAHEGTLYSHEARLIERVLRLDTVRVRDLMTPRTVVEMLPDQMTLAEARTRAGQWKHSRMPVHRADNPDDIRGVCRIRDILAALAQGGTGEGTIGRFMTPILFIPEGVSAHLLLDQFIESRQHIAAVIDEFGAFLGIVTLEDIIESLLGREIVDEYDIHADMQRFAREQARRRGLPIDQTTEEGPRTKDEGQRTK